jgi:annexin A7/11
MSYPAKQLRDAMSGMGTNEKKLIEVLAQVPDPAHMLKLRHTYDDMFRRSLLQDLEKETSGQLRATLVALCRGPLLEDAHLVHSAIAGAGTKENLLNTIVLGRTNADLSAIKLCFGQVYKRDMTREISDDLSLKTEQLFKYVLQAARAEEAAPVLPHEVDANTERLHSATEANRNVHTNQDEVCKLMAYSSDGMIRAIDLRYKAKYRKTLDELFKLHFSGHMRDALRLMAARAIDPIKSDADQLEATMHGMGTRDELLIERVVHAHWNKDHWRQVKIAFQRFHHRSLGDRVNGETSGDYRRLLMALVGQ